MSAFIVADATLQEIVHACRQAGLVSPEGADDLGVMLATENARSVAYRYSEPEPTPCNYRAEFSYHPRPTTVGQVAKSLHYYIYTSCEHPGWETSEARAVCLRLAVHLLEHVPGYSEADWR